MEKKGLEQQSARKHLRKFLTSNLFLTHYNSKQKIIVASDASSYVIGAYIRHKFDDGSIKPIAHVIRTLLPAEKNYFHIEKESLRIMFTVTKFHRFIHGRHFTLQTDHKPLLPIYGSKKGLPAHTTNRLH